MNPELIYKKVKRVFPRSLAHKLPKTVRVVLIHKETSRMLNARFRKKRKPTNVLSFRYDATYGEILLCPPVIRAEARTQGNTYAFQMTWMIVHGMIHLSGLHHEYSRIFAGKVARVEHEILSALGREKMKKLKIKMQNKSTKF